MVHVESFDPVPQLAAELGLPPGRIAAVVALLTQQNTVPFIARYRKEATGGLDEVQIRQIEERKEYLVELEQRRAAILSAIEEQGKLDAELRRRIEGCTTKAALEDLYLPFKPKRRTRATIARERGLEPLARRILEQPRQADPEHEAARFVDAELGVADAAAALAGARDIVAEQVTEHADIRALVRRAFAEQGVLVVAATPAARGQRTKYEQYYEFREAVATIPSHRFLAVRRGEREELLRAQIEVEAEPLVARIDGIMQLDAASPYAPALAEAVRDAFQRLLAPSVESEVRAELKQRSDRAAVDVFADNLRNLLLAPPLGGRAVIGIDPGLRTGCKCAAVNATGAFRGNLTIYLSKGEAAALRAKQELTSFIDEHRPAAIAIGNGTGGRETETFVRDLLAERAREAPAARASSKAAEPFVVQVNEAGASVYSASDLAREEFPDLDVTVRGAISIARRLQDPLAELVKVEPKAIGVGQYQHDVHQPLLLRKLAEVVESCVNHVGVELNTASAALLGYVAGIGRVLARKVVAHREANGAFHSRRELLDVSGLGPRAFEQAAGFLRIRGGANPLDASAVHPERYALVERIARDLRVALQELVGGAELAERVDISRYAGDGVGEPTLRDIIDELKKPGRDPRAEFAPPRFREDVRTLEDLVTGMVLEGVVTNVTAFGAFVDVGVHQDGLVHVSQLADRFIRDPKEVARVGDRIQVRVLDVDLERRRISLSARSPGAEDGGTAGSAPARRAPRSPQDDDAARIAGGAADPARDSGRRTRPGGGTTRDKGGRSGKQPPKQPDRFSNNPFAKLAKLKRDRS